MSPKPDNGPSEPAAKVVFSRRTLIGSALATAGGAATAGALAAYGVGETRPSEPAGAIVPCHGVHQAGIGTSAQQYVTFAALDLTVTDVLGLRSFLIDLTRTIEQITEGAPPPEKTKRPPGLSTHTDFSTGLSPARLTVTVGLGPSVFELLPIGSPAPVRLRQLPPFTGDGLDPRWCDGDMLLQVCADDPQIVSSALRSLRARMPGLASFRWTQNGFLSGPADGGTPRNMFGQKDGTANAKPDTAGFDDTVWALPDEPAWFDGGTYLVFRKIRMKTANWDLTTRDEQDAVIGRRRSDGAPLTGDAEFDAPDFRATTVDGTPIIANDAHIRRVRGIPMFRRSYSYDYGHLISSAGGTPDPTAATEEHDHATGEPAHAHGGHDAIDNGLLFCAYGNDPSTQFIAAQQRIAESDRLNGFVQHTGSAIFAVLPGWRPGGHLGETLL